MYTPAPTDYTTRKSAYIACRVAAPAGQGRIKGGGQGNTAAVPVLASVCVSHSFIDEVKVPRRCCDEFCISVRVHYLQLRVTGVRGCFRFSLPSSVPPSLHSRPLLCVTVSAVLRSVEEVQIFRSPRS